MPGLISVVEADINRIRFTARNVDNSGADTFDVGQVTRGGYVLARSRNNPAVYVLKGGEGYVRARVTDSGGFVAWTQPVFLER